MPHIYVISDLHMGDAGVRDNFSYHDKRGKFDAFLDMVNADAGAELFILGDLFEMWQGYAGEVLNRNRRFLDRLASMPVRYVYGNHDAEFAGDEGKCGADWLAHDFFRHRAEKRIERVIGGRRFAFVHGHEGDVFNDGNKPLSGNALAILAGIAEDALGSRYVDKEQNIPLEALLTGVGEKILEFFRRLGGNLKDRRQNPDVPAGPVRRGESAPHAAAPAGESPEELERYIEAEFRRSMAAPNASEPVRRGIVSDLAWGGMALALTMSGSRESGALIRDHLVAMTKLRGELGMDRLVCGHTHIPGKMADWYSNSGSWSDAGEDVLLIDEAGDVTFHKYEKKDGAFALTPAKEVKVFDEPK